VDKKFFTNNGQIILLLKTFLQEANIRESHNRYPVIGLIISLILEHAGNIIHSNSLRARDIR